MVSEGREDEDRGWRMDIMNDMIGVRSDNHKRRLDSASCVKRDSEEIDLRQCTIGMYTMDLLALLLVTSGQTERLVFSRHANHCYGFVLFARLSRAGHSMIKAQIRRSISLKRQRITRWSVTDLRYIVVLIVVVAHPTCRC